MMSLAVCFLESNFFEILWASWTSWKSISFARLGKFSFMFSNKFSISCSSSPFLYPYDSDVGTFKVVLEVPKPLLTFLNSCFFILFYLNVYFFLLVQIVDLSPSFLPFTVGSLYIFISLFIAFTSFCGHAQSFL